MIVMFSARRLKPGAWEQFRRAWDPGDDKPPGFQRAYHARNIRDGTTPGIPSTDEPALPRVVPCLGSTPPGLTEAHPGAPHWPGCDDVTPSKRGNGADYGVVGQLKRGW